MMYRTIISIVIPVYNGQNYISQTIESLLKQSFASFEIIILDDCSTDSTEQKIKRISDSRIKYVKNKKRKGSAFSINLGISLSSSKYICIIEPDSLSLRNRLELQVDYFESNSNIGGVGGLSAGDKIQGKVPQLGKPLGYLPLKVQLLKDNCFLLSTMMFRSHLLRKHNLFYRDTYKYACDYDFMVRASQAFQLSILNQELIQQKVSSDPISASKRIIQKGSVNKIRKCQLQFFDIPYTKKELGLHYKLMDGEYIQDSELKSCEVWLNKLYAANFKKKVFDQNYLYNLFENVLALAVYTNELGGWAIEKDMLKYIYKVLPKGKSILEFGSGIGTEALLRDYRVTSIEHDHEYAYKRADNHDCVLAPIHNDWFKRDLVKESLKKTYDLLIVDGPPLKLRKGILKNLDLFQNNSAPVIFDDVNRMQDKETMLQFCERLNYNYKIIMGKHKAFAFCTKMA